MCTPVLLHVIVRLIISVRSRSLTLAVPRFSVPNQSSWYEDNATFERFLAGVFGIVAEISVFVRFNCVGLVALTSDNQGCSAHVKFQ